MPLSPGSAVASAGTALPEGAGTEGPGSAAAGVLGELAISTASGVAPRLLLRQGGNELVSAGGTSCLTRCLCHSICTRRSSSRRGPCGAVRRHSSWAMAGHSGATSHRMAASWRTKQMRRIMVRRPNWNSLPYSMSHRHWRSSTWHHRRSRSHMCYWQSRPSWHHSGSQWNCWPHWNCWSCWQDAGWNCWPHWNCWSCHRDYPWRRHHWWASWRCCAHYSTEHPAEQRPGRCIITACHHQDHHHG